MGAAIRRVLLTAVAALVGYGVGWVCGAVSHSLAQQENYPFLAERLPLPHRVPQFRGGLSFRFAMAHDVIHERFPRHGPAYYRERDRLARAELAKLGPDNPAGFPVADDLAAGLERLGRSDEAVGVMRDKLARQRARGVSGRDLYTSLANLGTFLIHANLPRAMAGDRDARDRFREGVGLVRESVAVNPEAHFGRERWQAAIAEFLLAALDRPDLLTTFDCLGNRLDLDIQTILQREANRNDTGYGRPYDIRFGRMEAAEKVPAFFQPGADLDDPALWPEVSPIRQFLVKVGAEEGFDSASSNRAPAPFDEPTLGIIGMWRQGGGASPHFALALGETMLRVGQRYIAWSAFERAGRLAGRFWPDPAIQQSLRDHCRRRQARIEETMNHSDTEPGQSTPWEVVSPPPGPAAVAGLRATFDAELARGEGYQRAYQEYEAKKIAAGVPIADGHFFDDFHAGREPIESPTGAEEWFLGVTRARMNEYAEGRRQDFEIFGAGLAAMVAALLIRWSAGRRAALARKAKPLPEIG